MVSGIFTCLKDKVDAVETIHVFKEIRVTNVVITMREGLEAMVVLVGKMTDGVAEMIVIVVTIILIVQVGVGEDLTEVMAIIGTTTTMLLLAVTNGVVGKSPKFQIAIVMI